MKIGQTDLHAKNKKYKSRSQINSSENKIMTRNNRKISIITLIHWHGLFGLSQLELQFTAGT
jgi:hypothetical protein